MKKALLLVMIAETWSTLGQILLKKSADRLTIEENSTKNWALHLIRNIFRYPTLWMGITAMILGLLFWFTALGAGELSYVYLLGSIQYIFALIAAHFFLHEKIDQAKIIGTFLITLGVILTAAS